MDDRQELPSPKKLIGDELKSIAAFLCQRFRQLLDAAGDAVAVDNKFVKFLLVTNDVIMFRVIQPQYSIKLVTVAFEWVEVEFPLKYCKNNNEKKKRKSNP